MKYITNIDGQDFTVEILDEKHIRINDKVLDVDFEAISGQPVYSLIIGGKSYEAYVSPDDEKWEVLLHGRLYQAEVEDEREKRLRSASSGGLVEGGEYQLKSPMPGLVVAILVEEGQQIVKGQVLLILESMKMQNELKAARDGTISRVRVRSGESVEQKQTLLSVI
ncbi:MAG: acetyl-CoA carboxylase biotin carboxyl carrier protein subunit [Anaerolineales bacterium]|jgi:biotin carboxyl carrier protein|nr:acetyl-CoA carboxylase biotin carboxyl carrier protein subunit [Anaerolineales bacterium]